MSSAAFAVPDRALVLDRYRPLKPLGRGGSGSVWLARDEQTGLEVALKIVPREGKRAARAAREMEAASRLRHERCVRAYDFGGDTGHVYIAYEYVRGRTLREVLRAEEVDDAGAVEIAAQMLDGLAQFDEADTLTAVGDVPGTLAYISPERLSGKEASERSDVWAVGVILWEALAGSHPFWGVPLPQVASTIASGAPPLSARRGDLPRRLLAAIDAALSVDPAKRPQAARLAADLREAFVVPLTRTRPERKPARAARVAKPPRPKAAPVPLWQRLAPAGMASLATLVGGSLVPFWPGPLLAALAAAAGLAAFRAPRLGLAVALAAPVFPLGNVAQAAAVVYGFLALAWLAVTWRDPRAGLAFWAGPLLGVLGLLPLLPLAVQPARGWWRRGLHAGAGVCAAAAVAGLAGKPLPLTGTAVDDLGIAETERPTDVLNALGTLLGDNTAIATTALALGIVAALLPWALSRGQWGIVGLGALQLMLVFAWAPSIPWVGFVFGTLLLCGLLVARPYLGTILRRSGG